MSRDEDIFHDRDKKSIFVAKENNRKTSDGDLLRADSLTRNI